MTPGVEQQPRASEARPAYVRFGLALFALGLIVTGVLGVIAEARIATRQQAALDASLRLSAGEAARAVETRLALLAERVRTDGAGRLEAAPAPSEEHSLVSHLNVGPDPLIAAIGPAKGGTATKITAGIDAGKLTLRIPTKDGAASAVTLRKTWLDEALVGLAPAGRGYLVVTSNGFVAGSAGAAANLPFKADERLPLTVIAESAPFQADRIATWAPQGKPLRLAAAALEPGLVIAATQPQPGVLTALVPILGLAGVPFGLGLALVLILWRQARALGTAEARRTTAEDLFEMVSGSAGCGFWDWDVEGGRIFWSGAALGLVGRPARGTWLTLPETYQLLHPAEVSKLEGLRQVMEDGGPNVEAVIRLQSITGRTIWCEARLRRWRDLQRVRLVGLLVDVTAQTEARLVAEAAAERTAGDRDAWPVGDLNAAADSANALRATIEDLERRRAELTQKYAAEKSRGEDGTRAKTEFLANMSHELKTPLNAIIGFSEIMHNELYGAIGDERYRDYARDIHASGRALSQLIDDILEMSKIEAGRVKLDAEPLDLGELVEHCVRLIEPRAREVGVMIENRVGHVPEAFGDRRATKRILMNLLSNAVKFTHRGGRVGLGAATDPGFVTLSVSDDGIGIPEADLARIGRPFEQVEQHQSRRHRGTGLGLAISLALSEMQGGALAIQSTEGVGTTVSFKLPRRAREDGARERFQEAG
jgi:signal transduction histidine kinase